jgi:hypothetical protein
MLHLFGFKSLSSASSLGETKEYDEKNSVDIRWRIITPSHDGVHTLVGINHQREGEIIPQCIKVLGALLDPVVDVAEDRLYSTNCDPGCSLARHPSVHQVKADQ